MSEENNPSDNQQIDQDHPLYGETQQEEKSGFRKLIEENAFVMAMRSDSDLHKILYDPSASENLLLDSEEEYKQYRTSINSKNFFMRTFGPIGEGSIRGSIFSMASLCLGTGCLTLPIRFTQLSLLGGILFLIVGGLASYWSLTLMIKAAKIKGQEDYSRLVKVCLGKKIGVLLDCILLVYIFGVMVSFQVIVYSLIGRVFYEFGIDKDKYPTFEDYESDQWNRKIYKAPIMLGTAAILIPLCALKDISKMRFASMFAIIALIIVIMVVVVQSPFYYKDYKKNIKEGANYYDLSKAFDTNMYFFPSLATIFFTYTCHIGAFPVYKSLKNHRTRRVHKVFRRSVILIFLIYFAAGVSGFFTAPVDCPDLIIYRRKLFKNDIIMTIGKIAITITLLLCTPANFNCFRISFFELAFGTTEITNLRNIIVTCCTMFICATLGIIYSKITSYISLLGGFCSTFIAFFIPGVVYLKITPGSYTSFDKMSTMVIVALLTMIGFIAGVETVVGMTRGE